MATLDAILDALPDVALDVLSISFGLVTLILQTASLCLLALPTLSYPYFLYCLVTIFPNFRDWLSVFGSVAGVIAGIIFFGLAVLQLIFIVIPTILFFREVLIWRFQNRIEEQGIFMWLLGRGD